MTYCHKALHIHPPKKNPFNFENAVCFIRNINLKSFIINILKNILLTPLSNPFLHMLFFLIQRLSCFGDNSLQSHHTSIAYLTAALLHQVRC